MTTAAPKWAKKLAADKKNTEHYDSRMIVMLTKSQKAKLNSTAKATKLPAADLVREALTKAGLI